MAPGTCFITLMASRAQGAQRHLQHFQAARDQRLGDRQGMGDVLDHQHRDHRGGAHDGVDRDGHWTCSFWKAAAAPAGPAADG
jgi:hypothetical protein